ncbi:MAG TPA: hypothetical protein DCE71_08340 [Parachlamydiales bacterium]|nr:hypothetical protein [Parachlamydiales bacterium]
MSYQFIISGIATISSSLPAPTHIETLAPSNETDYPSTIYTDRSRFGEAVDTGLAFSETAVSAINQTVANATETALSLTNHLPPSLFQAAAVLTTSSAPGGGPGDVPPSYIENATLGNLSNGTLIDCIPSISKTDINTNFLEGISYVFWGAVAALVVSIFTSSAIKGYLRYRECNQTSQFKEKRIEVKALIERQKLIEAELTRKRFKSRAQTLSHALKFNKILTKEQV